MRLRPHLWARKLNVVASTPSPYCTLRLKLIDEASSKYFVGQEISPMLKSEHDRLRDHLVVEDKIVGVFQQRQGLQQFAREGAESGVVLRELHAQPQVLEGA